MPNQSFFHLSAPPLEAPFDPHLDWCISLSQAEHDAVLDQALPLGDTLVDTIDAYCEAHGDLSFGVILEALRYLYWVIEHQMAEESADA